MATLNRIKKEFTHEGARAVRINPLAQLERSVMSCLLWESEFYEDGQTIGQRIADLVKAVSAEDVARVAIQAKEDMRLRHVPLLLVRELMRTVEGRTMARSLFPRVILRPDDITEFLCIYWKDNKEEPLAKQVKRCLGDTFRKFDEYQLAKYNGGQKAVKLRDALRMTRPKPAHEAQAELWHKLAKGELATPDTWEVELSRGGNKKQPFQHAILGIMMREGNGLRSFPSRRQGCVLPHVLVRRPGPTPMLAPMHVVPRLSTNSKSFLLSLPSRRFRLRLSPIARRFPSASWSVASWNRSSMRRLWKSYSRNTLPNSIPVS